jgi:hypothetical protein
MKKLIFAIFIAFVLYNTVALSQDMNKTNWEEIEKIFGKKGGTNGDVFKVTYQRTDLNVTYDNIKIEPALALTSWIAFKDVGMGTMMMGDMVLTDDELETAIKNLSAKGLEISGIHNHINNTAPDIKYLHFGGMGDAKTLASEINEIFANTKTPMEAQTNISKSKQRDWTKVENILGRKGSLNGSVEQFGIPRNEKITEMGAEIPPYMGMSTTINIQMVDNGKAFATGDFVLLADEINPVIKVLSENNIAVTALHNHMTNETPRLFFMHYWGYDTPENIAEGLKKALDKTNSSK